VNTLLYSQETPKSEYKKGVSNTIDKALTRIMIDLKGVHLK